MHPLGVHDRYECQFGPDDRSGETLAVTPEMVPKPQKYNNKGKQIYSGKGSTGPRITEAKEGGSIKVGCRCRFHIKTYFFLPHVAEITYNQTQHVNAYGITTHSKDNAGSKFRYRKNISSEIRVFVRNLYLAGVPISKIHQMHCEAILKARDDGTLVPSRDCFLSELDIRNMAGVLQRDTYMKDPNDAESVRMWVRDNLESIFFFQESGARVNGLLTAENMPFVIGIQTPYQFRMMNKHGHRGAISLDATFGTNDKKVRSQR